VKAHTFVSAGVSGGGEAPALEWVVLDGRDATDRTWLESTGRFNDAVKAIITTAPQHNEHVHLEAAIVMSLARNDDTTGDATQGMHVVIEPRRVATVCYGMERLAGEVFEREIARGAPTSASRVLSLLVGALVKQLQPELTHLDDTIDALEDAAMRGSEEQIDDQVVMAGQQILALRRIFSPLNYEINYLAFNPNELPGGAEPRYLRRAAETLTRLVGGLDAAHHRVLLMLNQLGNRDTSRLEKAMHKLTLIATVFLPMGFVTGLLGINVAGIPGTHDPYAFWLVCGMLIAVAVGALLLIRWRRWM
jgi:zinc transporter